jgi:predicted phosphodiesterase
VFVKYQLQELKLARTELIAIALNVLKLIINKNQNNMKNKNQSKWAIYDEKIKEQLLISPSIGNSNLAVFLYPMNSKKSMYHIDIDSLRKYISRNRERLSNYDKLHMCFTPTKEELANTGIIKHIKAPLKQSKSYRRFKPFTEGDPDNILFIGDIHAPFDIEEYVKFCYDQQIKYNCGTVVFIGDVIDNHFSSYHESDPDGYSAGEELDRAINRLSDYYFTFPIATVIVGNHDRLVYRKAFSAGVSKRWIKDYKDVLDTPKWNFVESIELFGVNVNHGEGGTAKNRIKKELQSQIQGHLHSEFYVEYLVGAKFIIFGMQVGCGVDNKSYAMAYGKNYKKPAIGCGVLLEKGTLPMVIPMKM